MARSAHGQSLLERSPNLSGAWVGPAGTLHFNFLHRFTRTSAPTRKVQSSPTFLLAAGLPRRTLAGLNYATNSDVAPRYPNEWEFFGRVLPITQENGGPLELALQGGYNLAARSVDGEVTIGRQLGPARVRVAARVLSDAYGLGETRTVIAGGGVLRLGRYVALAGDYASMLNRPVGFDAAWSGALQLAIPYTPHTLSLQAANTNTATLQGSSASRGGMRRYGFEFTIPVTLRRYFPRRAPPATVVDTVVPRPEPVEVARRDTAARPDDPIATPEPVIVERDTLPPPRADRADTVPPRRPAPAAPLVADTVEAEMRQLAFVPARIEITAGTTVAWTNRDPVEHTVTADGGRWDSGTIDPGATWRRRFDRPGTYTFHCVPHPFMKGVVVVR